MADYKSALLITGSFVTVFLISQVNWAYNHNDFSNVTLRLFLASVTGVVAGALYIYLFKTIISRLTCLDKANNIVNGLSEVHLPFYLLWFYLLNIQLGIGSANIYLFMIVPLLSLLNIHRTFIKDSSSRKIDKQIPYIQISIFSSIIAITLTYFYYQDINGLSDDSTGITKTLGLGLLLLNLPYFITYVYKCKANEDQFPWYRSQAFNTVLILSVLTFSGFLLKDENYYLGYFLSASGYGFFLLILCQYIYVSFLKKLILNAIFLYAFLAFSLWVTAIIGKSNHAGPFYLKKIFLGTVGIDPIFHASVSHIIQTYMIPSTGIDGLPYMYFHWGSHWLFAQLSKLIPVTPFHFYELSYSVIFVSIFFQSLLLVAVELRKFYHIPKDSDPELFKVHTFIIFAALFISFIPLTAPSLSPMTTGMGMDSWLISQSYLVSVTITFLTFCILITFWNNSGCSKQIKKTDILLLYLIFPFLTAIVGLSKISTLFIVFIVISYLIIRLGLYRNIHYVSSYVLSLFMLLIVHFASTPRGGILIEPLHYIKNYMADPWKPFHITFYYLWAFLFVYLKVKSKAYDSVYQFKNAFFNRTTLDVEIIILVSLIGFLPGALFALPGGAAAYFSGFQLLISLSFLIAFLTEYDLKLKPGTIVLIVFLMPFFYTVYNNGETLFSEYRSEAQNLKNHSIDNTSKEYKILEILHDLSKLPLPEKRRSLLFIPKNNIAYWNLSKGDTKYRCKYVPFIAPALSGIAMIDGLPQINCNAKYYGYDYYYSILENQQAEIDRTNSSLCNEILDKGYYNLIRIDQNENGFRQTIVECK